MNRFGIFGIGFTIMIIILIQIVIFKNLVFYGSAFCFFYVLALFMMPIDTNPLVQLLSGFLIGLVIDMSYNTQGVHASASTAIMFLRPFWINMLSPGSGYGSVVRINIKTQGLQWFLTYAYPLILIHCLILFFVEAFGFSNFWMTMSKSFYSSLFTLFIVVVIQYLFFSKQK